MHVHNNHLCLAPFHTPPMPMWLVESICYNVLQLAYMWGGKSFTSVAAGQPWTSTSLKVRVKQPASRSSSQSQQPWHSKMLLRSQCFSELMHSTRLNFTTVKIEKGRSDTQKIGALWSSIIAHACPWHRTQRVWSGVSGPNGKKTHCCAWFETVLHYGVVRSVS